MPESRENLDVVGQPEPENTSEALSVVSGQPDKEN